MFPLLFCEQTPKMFLKSLQCTFKLISTATISQNAGRIKCAWIFCDVVLYIRIPNSLCPPPPPPPTPSCVESLVMNEDE